MGNISSNNSSKQPNHNADGSHKPLQQNGLEEADATRNREILSKAISAVIFLLLKWTKVSRMLDLQHDLCKQYDSQAVYLFRCPQV